MNLTRLSLALLCALTLSAPSAAQSLQQQQAERDAENAQRAAENAALASDRAQQAAAAAEMKAMHESNNAKKTRAPLSDRDELALAALEGLMSAPEAKVLPMLKKVLNGTHGDLVKARALFVLSQIELEEAQQTLLEFVRNGKGELRGEAVRSIGIGGNAKSLEALLPMLQSAEGDLRPQVLEAFLIADREDLVLKAVQSAKSESEARDAIRTLSAMGAIEELRQLGAQGKYTDSLIEAYAIAGDLASLRRIAETATETKLRKEAISSIGIIGSKESKLALRELYAKSGESSLKAAALEGMMISGDEEGVLALYRAASNLQEKRSLLSTLSMMGGDAALEAIDAALEGKSP